MTAAIHAVAIPPVPVELEAMVEQDPGKCTVAWHALHLVNVIGMHTPHGFTYGHAASRFLQSYCIDEVACSVRRMQCMLSACMRTLACQVLLSSFAWALQVLFTHRQDVQEHTTVE